MSSSGKGGLPLLHIIILVPFLLALVIALLTKKAQSLHRGWLVFPVSLALFVYFLTRIPVIKGENWDMKPFHGFPPSELIWFSTWMD